ncbi:hypothetical protein Q0M94_10700 [Deinococcus radiomollis]|uniref:hypothetical protein n=1 Tax=Deinococcus radiomollis TaxID=468916 RepID=UPI0038915B4A
MRFVFKFNGQALFDGIYEFQDERDKEELALHLRTHLGKIEVMRSFSTTGVRQYDHRAAAAWLNASPAVGRTIALPPTPSEQTPAIRFQNTKTPAWPQETPGLKPDGTVVVSLMSNSTQLFGHPVRFRDEAQYQLYTHLLRRFVQSLRITEAEQKPSVAPNPSEWSFWFARSRHPGWELGTHLLDDLHFELTGFRPATHKNAVIPRQKKEQKANKVVAEQSAAATPKDAKKPKGPSPVISKNNLAYLLWVGEHLLNTTPIRLTPEEVTRLLGLLKHCVHPPDTVIRAAPHPKQTVGVLFNRLNLYARCRDQGQFDLPRLAECFELILPRERSGESRKQDAAPNPPTPDGARSNTPAPKSNSPVWPGQHPRPHEWATSDRIEFNVFEYK